MFPIILCDFEFGTINKKETLSYYDYVRIKLDNLSVSKSLKYLKKEIKKHKKQIKSLKKKDKKLIDLYGYSAHKEVLKKKYDELNFLNQKYTRLLNLELEYYARG